MRIERSTTPPTTTFAVLSRVPEFELIASSRKRYYSLALARCPHQQDSLADSPEENLHRTRNFTALISACNYQFAHNVPHITGLRSDVTAVQRQLRDPETIRPSRGAISPETPGRAAACTLFTVGLAGDGRVEACSMSMFPVVLRHRDPTERVDFTCQL